MTPISLQLAKELLAGLSLPSGFNKKSTLDQIKLLQYTLELSRKKENRGLVL